MDIEKFFAEMQERCAWLAKKFAVAAASNDPDMEIPYGDRFKYIHKQRVWLFK